jgi:hypothetical protein
MTNNKPNWAEMSAEEFADWLGEQYQLMFQAVNVRQLAKCKQLSDCIVKAIKAREAAAHFKGYQEGLMNGVFNLTPPTDTKGGE